MTTKYFVTTGGAYLGAFDGVQPPEGSVEVPSPPTHASDVRVGNNWAKSSARQAEELYTAQLAQAKADAKADAFVQQFVAMTPAQVIAYVNDNVSTLADAKQLLTKLSLMMLALAKEQYK